MKLTVLYFGQAAEASGKCKEEKELASPTTVAALKSSLLSIYPDLQKFPFQVAVNQQIAADDTIITPPAEVAILPPYAGG